MSTRIELGLSLGLKEKIIPKRNANRTRIRFNPKKIAIHNTSNTTKGADANAHSRYLINKAGDSGYGPTSWHYTVDHIRVIKHLPLGERGIHAYESGNRSSIGVEMCMNSDGDWKATFDRTARLVAVLCFDFGWSVDGNTKQHHDFPRANGTRKNCPIRIRSSRNNSWDSFLKLAASYLKKILEAEEISGFSASKRVPEVESILPPPDEFNRGHGEIIIPDKLLSKLN